MVRRSPTYATLRTHNDTLSLYTSYFLLYNYSMYKLFTDGGSRGNPGKAAIGYFLFDKEDKLVDFGGEYIGENTNNNAEYNGLIAGLKLAKKNDVKEINCNLDSELVVKQLNGEYKVKHPDMQTLFAKVEELKKNFTEIKFTHVRREFNKHADKMVNTILDSI